MSKGKDTPRHAAYLKAAEPWRDELEQLRRIVLDCGLTEEVKWGAPCFTADGGNVAILGALNEYCCLSFFKGVLLADPEGLLDAPGDHTRSGRMIRFTEVDRILEIEPTLKAYVREAADLERAGAKVDFAKDRDDVPIPVELQAKLDESADFRTAWEALTPGRRRAYLLHFTGAKQSATRTARIERHAPRILQGKGMNDR
jgi:uncharacterized protein YdeI (YjbR/CyaY-like superfamily)